MTTRGKSSGFTTTEVSKLTGVSVRKLRWWDRQGLVRPGRVKPRKIGQWRHYTLQDIVCVLVVRALRDRGLTLQQIRESVLRVQIAGVEHPLARLRVACLAHAVVFREGGKYVEPLSGQIVIEEALHKIRPKLDRRSFVSGVRAIERAHTEYKEKVTAF